MALAASYSMMRDGTQNEVTGNAVQESDEFYYPDNEIILNDTDYTEDNSSGNNDYYYNEELPDNDEEYYRGSTGSCTDSACNEDEICYEGACRKPGCTSDADCVDDDGCSEDVCMFAGHPNAFCSINRITRFRNNDGCCPPDANIDKDTDCAPVCGNRKCEYGETTDTCEKDCRNAGSGISQAPPSSPPPTSPN
jgi:hypothetical protein